MVSLAAGSLMTGISGWFSVRAFQDAKLLAEIGSTPMAELTDGLHEVRGTVQGAADFKAPISQRACLGWRLLVEQQRRSSWEVVYDTREMVPFGLGDGTGNVQVDAGKAELVLARSARVGTGVLSVPSPEWDALKARLGDPAIEPSTPFLRWKEETIEPEDVITAIGNFAREGEAWAVSPENLLLSDRDDAEVVRQQRRRGQRHAMWAMAGVAVLAYGVWSLVGATA
jgi:hypothetical protein